MATQPKFYSGILEAGRDDFTVMAYAGGKLFSFVKTVYLPGDKVEFVIEDEIVKDREYKGKITRLLTE